MVLYRRDGVPGDTYFFTLTLANRSDRTLIEQIDALRWSLRETRTERPFEIMAMAILPDHLHAIFRLIQGALLRPVSARDREIALPQARSFQPVRKIHHTTTRQTARKPTIATRLMPTFTSATP